MAEALVGAPLGLRAPETILCGLVRRSVSPRKDNVLVRAPVSTGVEAPDGALATPCGIAGAKLGIGDLDNLVWEASRVSSERDRPPMRPAFQPEEALGTKADLLKTSGVGERVRAPELSRRLGLVLLRGRGGHPPTADCCCADGRGLGAAFELLEAFLADPFPIGLSDVLGEQPFFGDGFGDVLGDPDPRGRAARDLGPVAGLSDPAADWADWFRRELERSDMPVLQLYGATPD